MAIYHCTVKIGTKDKGHSAGGKCAYITRTENHAKKADECAYTGSGNMPKWPKTNPQQDPAHYWKAADLYERDNGRLFREVEFALPRELNLDQQKALCHAFAERLTTLDKGEKLPYTFAIHTDQDNKNPHCHLMISERINDKIPRNASTWFKRANPKDPKKGGAVKTQELNGKQWLEPTRQLWAQMANEALKSALPDFNERTDGIDHRSHATRGLAAIPGEHLGKACHDMMRRGAHCHRGQEIAKRNRTAVVMNRHMGQYPVPRSRIGKAVIQHWRISSAKHFGGLRPDGSPKTMEDILRDINRLMNDIFRTSMQIAKAQEKQALEELRLINERAWTVKQCRDALGLSDSGTAAAAVAVVHRPPAPVAVQSPQPMPKAMMKPKKKRTTAKRPKPVPPWLQDSTQTQ